MSLPRITIDLDRIDRNARRVRELYARRGVEIMGVTKAVLGCPRVGRALVRAGVATLADSRVENLERLRAGGVAARLVLLRTSPSVAARAVELADLSLNSELATLEALSAACTAAGRSHRVLLMAEMGDLREGVAPAELPALAAAAEALPGLEVAGIGCNLACFGGVAPDAAKMRQLSRLVERVEARIGRRLGIVSGGNSANHDWLVGGGGRGRIDSLRLGELLLLGRETLDRKIVPGLATDAFVLSAEVIESGVKPTAPAGPRGRDAFGELPAFADHGERPRALLALGRQDVRVRGLSPRGGARVLGASSDHLIVEPGRRPLAVGDVVDFDLDYAALLAAMTSPFVCKEFRAQ